MKQGSILLLKGVLVLMGLAVLGFCIVLLPIGISSDTTGYYRPLLFGMYVPAIPFFIALYQAWKLLKYIEKNNAFSELSIEAFKKIKYSGIAISALYAAGMPYIFYAADRDDAPGVVAMALVIIFASGVIATFAGVLQKLIESALEIKSENDLTV